MPTHTSPDDPTNSETAISTSPAPFTVQTTFRHMRSSAAVADHVVKEAQKLQRHFERITHCHVVIAAPHKHHRHGRQYAINVELGVPHGPLVVNHEPALRTRDAATSRDQKRSIPNTSHDDIYVTLRDTFDVVRRRLEVHARRLRGDAKRRTPRRQVEDV